MLIHVMGHIKKIINKFLNIFFFFFLVCLKVDTMVFSRICNKINATLVSFPLLYYITIL